MKFSMKMLHDYDSSSDSSSDDDIYESISIPNNNYLHKLNKNNTNKSELISVKFYSLIKFKQVYNIDKVNSTHLCSCCTSYFTIHISNAKSFINKYKKNTQNINKQIPSSKLIKILYRLDSKLFTANDISQIKFLKDLISYNSGIPYTDFWYNQYNNLFFQPNLIYEDFISCTICGRVHCPIHYILNPFLHFSCEHCDKKWDICSWCKFTTVPQGIADFIIESNKLSDSKILCDIFHKNIEF